MEKKKLPRLEKRDQALGRDTIMDRALAARHGIEYVQLTAFAIDVDRIREEVEGYEDPRPFGWEVVLCEAYLLARFDPNRRPEQVLLFEDIVISVLEGEGDALGGQIVFAIWDAIERGRFPARLAGAFDTWKQRPDELVKELELLWENEAELVRRLAEGCLEVEISPPITPQTIEMLETMKT